ncbi:hypothetical protein NQ318_021362 [Aromia moschata]|uniref:Uncharacterized protein n=1 Tax=Aromia moschata TaxID=1265417 RepID=A0AAV8ZCC9_9CUCU|nr:hypothetical protein NQ318_021362 [Aromia moschata]
MTSHAVIGLQLTTVLLYLKMIACDVRNEGDQSMATFGPFQIAEALKKTERLNATAFADDLKGEDGRNYESGSGNQSSHLFEESRKQKQNKNQKGFMERILPMMVIPFMVSTSMIPMMLIGIKIMLLKSALVGAIGISLMLLNMFRRRTGGGGVYTHNINANDEAMQYYGYHGDEEYGAYVNTRRRRRRRRRKRNVDDG